MFRVAEETILELRRIVEQFQKDVADLRQDISHLIKKVEAIPTSIDQRRAHEELQQELITGIASYFRLDGATVANGQTTINNGHDAARVRDPFVVAPHNPPQSASDRLQAGAAPQVAPKPQPADPQPPPLPQARPHGGGVPHKAQLHLNKAKPPVASSSAPSPGGATQPRQAPPIHDNPPGGQLTAPPPCTKAGGAKFKAPPELPAASLSSGPASNPPTTPPWWKEPPAYLPPSKALPPAAAQNKGEALAPKKAPPLLPPDAT